MPARRPGGIGAAGRSKVFLHAVGRNNRLPILDLDDSAWTDLVSLNLSTAYWTGQAVGREMCAAGCGRMVFLSSVSGLLAHAHHAPYAATEGGPNQLVRVMAREWAPHGVTANAVAPGYIETDLTRDCLARPSSREDLVSLVPAGRLGTTSEVADAVTYGGRSAELPAPVREPHRPGHRGRDRMPWRDTTEEPIDHVLAVNRTGKGGRAGKLRSMTPTGRIPRPEEVAGTALFLASEDASHITGTYMVADGASRMVGPEQRTGAVLGAGRRPPGSAPHSQYWAGVVV